MHTCKDVRHGGAAAALVPSMMMRSRESGGSRSKSCKGYGGEDEDGAERGHCGQRNVGELELVGMKE